MTLAEEMQERMQRWFDLAMEMTGHTSNVEEAFDQWKRERVALAENYESAKAHQEGEDDVRKFWPAVKRLLEKYMSGSMSEKDLREYHRLCRGLDRAAGLFDESEEEFKAGAKHYRQLGLPITTVKEAEDAKPTTSG